MSFREEIKKLKELNKKRNKFLFGFENPEKNTIDKVLKVVQYLFDGYPVVEGINYKLEKGWLFVTDKDLNKQKIVQLGFKPYKNGFVKKIFKDKNFIFKIN